MTSNGEAKFEETVKDEQNPEEKEHNPEDSMDGKEEPAPEEKQLKPEDSLDGERDKDEKEVMNPGPHEDNAMDNSDQDSPRGILEIPISGAYSDSSSSSSSSDTSSVDKVASPRRASFECQNFQWRNLMRGLIMRKKSSVLRLPSLPAAATRSLSYGRRTERIKKIKNPVETALVTADVAVINGQARPSWRSFEYAELAAATSGFSPENLIGKGGHAEVYKGCLADGQLVAVKRLIKAENEEKRIGDFLSELGIIAHVNHPNAAQLVGFSVEEGLHLVLRFSPHGSLASVLHGSKEGLEWKVRFNIALGVAEGLLYLHEGCQRRIIHRDIKASNILLTEDFQPQISDFGLAKWLPDKSNHHVVFPIEGTFGYLAPEYFMHGVVNEKTDVFAFGVLLLELITGRRAVNSSRQSLVIWAKPLLEANSLKELVDPSLMNAYDAEEMARAVQAASMCIHHISISRPYMNKVVLLLTGEEGKTEPITKESTLKSMRLPFFDSGDLEEYTRSRYLNDLNRHKQLALEQ